MKIKVLNLNFKKLDKEYKVKINSGRKKILMRRISY